MNTLIDTNHRWLVWFQPTLGDALVIAAFDLQQDAVECAARSPRRFMREHLAWLPTATVLVARVGMDVHVGQMYPAPGEILVCESQADGRSEAAGRGIVTQVADGEFAVAVPVMPPRIGDGPSLWSLGQAMRRAGLS